jgi:hypothetical protein
VKNNGTGDFPGMGNFPQGIKDFSYVQGNFSNGTEDFPCVQGNFSNGERDFPRGMGNFPQGIKDFSYVQSNIPEGIEDFPYGKMVNPSAGQGWEVVEKYILSQNCAGCEKGL